MIGGEDLRDARSRANMTQERLAELVGVNRLIDDPEAARTHPLEIRILRERREARRRARA